jgi:hypothetical protein
MYYIVNNNTQLFQDLKSFQARLKASLADVRSLLSEYNAASASFSQDHLSGPPIGFKFELKTDVPVKWKRVSISSTQTGYYMPKKCAATKDCIERMEAIPVLSVGELNKLVNFEHQFVEHAFLRRAGVLFGNEFCLVMVDDRATYKPASDMEEITITAFKRYEKAINDERSAASAN